jgi:hypothetical protein
VVRPRRVLVEGKHELPRSTVRIEVQRDDSSVAAAADADTLGRFRIELQEGGRVRLRVSRDAPNRPVETSWIGI